MQAIILAAGMGKRLKELTKNNTKCMVKVNGVTLIDRMLHQIYATMNWYKNISIEKDEFRFEDYGIVDKAAFDLFYLQ